MSKTKRSFVQELCIKKTGFIMQKLSMVWPGCRIGVAVSGGVDSFVLLKILKIRQAILPFKIELIALHLNPGFSKNNHSGLLPWLAAEGIAAHIELTDYGPKAHSEENLRNSSCFRCAWLRRKRLFELCRQYNLSHLALGHNADDLAATFFLNLCRNGRVCGMQMVEPFFDGKLVLIRPLLLLEKKYIRQAARQWQLPVFENACPSCGNTARSAMENMLNFIFSQDKNYRKSIIKSLVRWQMDLNFRKDGNITSRESTDRKSSENS